MRILVTGSRGFVGVNLTRYLQGRGFTVLSLDVTPPTDIRADDAKELLGLT